MEIEEEKYYKIRVERSLGVTSVYVNDIRVASGADTTNYTGTPNEVWMGFNGYATSYDVQTYWGLISGFYFTKAGVPAFDLRNSYDFKNVLNRQVVVQRQYSLSYGNTSLSTSGVEAVIGALDTYSDTEYSTNKVGSIYYNGSASLNTSITWSGYFPGGTPNANTTYVFSANTGDFCIDGWIFPTPPPDGCCAAKHTPRCNIGGWLNPRAPGKTQPKSRTVCGV